MQETARPAIKSKVHTTERGWPPRNTHDQPAQGFSFRCEKQPQTAHGSGTGKLAEAAWGGLARGKRHCAGGQVQTPGQVNCQRRPSASCFTPCPGQTRSPNQMLRTASTLGSGQMKGSKLKLHERTARTPGQVNYQRRPSARTRCSAGRPMRSSAVNREMIKKMRIIQQTSLISHSNLRVGGFLTWWTYIRLISFVRALA